MWKLTVCGCGCEQNRRGGQNEMTYSERGFCSIEKEQKKKRW